MSKNRIYGRDPFAATDQEGFIHNGRIAGTNIVYTPEEYQAAGGKCWTFHCGARKFLTGGDGLTSRLAMWYLVNNSEKTTYDVKDLTVFKTDTFEIASGAKETWDPSEQKDVRVNLYLGHNLALQDSVFRAAMTGTRKHLTNLKSDQVGKKPSGVEFFVAAEAGVSAPTDMTNYDQYTVICDIDETKQMSVVKLPLLRLAPLGQLLLMINMPVANVMSECSSRFILMEAIKDMEF